MYSRRSLSSSDKDGNSTASSSSDISILVHIPEDERPHASLQPGVIHRAPPSPQHNHANGQNHTFISPASSIDLGIIIDLMHITEC
ncbi:hypothetical protein HO173_003258 [Letharia columbiana]|uniref:Uncharacterized protein n=1 Tax=Letharia columbiana TaxID=112416 RepID=A0A8H6L7V2_9LECA|nr:uncharacterized protein HO173_003258 [Letharia columbiana]KAF6238751.1 hypothetical protein HO173_003258 [Letharia columbiana]